LNRDILGKQGEKIAKNYFLAKRYLLIKENYRFERAETDLIFEDRINKTIIFVEVKARTSKTYGEPEESITNKKIENLVKSAEGFLMEHPEFDEYEKRFDIVSVYMEGNKEVINHLQDAF
jgi:putative endonuclease